MGPFLFVTGRPDETLQQFVAEHPGTAMLAKPFTQGELTSAIHQLYGATQRASIKQRLSPPVPFGPSTLHPNAGTRSGKIDA
jgi:DNA-binding response OmpR family regulator